YADSINAETVVVVGERDLANGEYTVKDMESGDETTVSVEEFPPEDGLPTDEDYE
ncbi:MAG: His/Gly/Thr/Pro-type tRNA ligase C-terminal domain-containing protein, partial [Halorubrum sp.]